MKITSESYPGNDEQSSMTGFSVLIRSSLFFIKFPYAMRAFKQTIDYDGLEDELHEALRADELYSLQNDAKFRAIEQAVPTYEDFRQMVNAAHLKPLDRKDMIPKVGVKWNSIVNDIGNSHPEKHRLKESLEKRSSTNISFSKIPKNHQEFRRIWESLINDHSGKFQLLSESRLILTSQIFRSGIPPDVLIECLVTCLKSLQSPDNETLIIDILSKLSDCHRFKLAVEFMTEEDKYVCEKLFQALRKSVTVKDKKITDDLEKKYLR